MEAERDAAKLKSARHGDALPAGPLAAALKEELDRVQAHASCVPQDGHAAATLETLDGRAEDLVAGLQAMTRGKPPAGHGGAGEAEST